MVIEIERAEQIRLYDGEIRYNIMRERRKKNHESVDTDTCIMITLMMMMMIQYRDAKHDTMRMLN